MARGFGAMQPRARGRVVRVAPPSNSSDGIEIRKMPVWNMTIL